MKLEMRHVGLAIALVVIVAAILIIEPPGHPGSTVPPNPTNIPASELQYPAAADFGGATGWVNTNGQPINLVALRGGVVLVDFWTYSCINCIHTFPHVESDYQKYKAYGLTVVGVHTPEFNFERDITNIQNAAKRYNLTYPIAVDSDYSIWNAYSNEYWPAEYLIDQYGRIRHTNFGEGGYVETETAIRELLNESGHPVPSSVPFGIDDTATTIAGQTPELYAAEAEGADRVAIGNTEGYHVGSAVTYSRPADLTPAKIYLVGKWFDGEQNDTALDNESTLVNFTAAAGNVVADGPNGTCVSVFLDGRPIPSNMAGRDVLFGAGLNGGIPCMMLDGPRSYDFYAGPAGTHTVELGVPRGFGLFTFDFTGT
ncbi:MAG: redoxin domain-containing protein [Thermoplasmatota archaeon]